MSVKKLTTGPSAILLATLEAMALQYDWSQLSNAQNDLWPHPWRNVILFMSLSVRGELGARAARIIRSLPNDDAQTSREITYCQKCNLQLFSSCFIVFAFFKPPLQEEMRQSESLPGRAPRDAFTFFILNARGKIRTW